MSLLTLDYCGKIYSQGNTRVHAVAPTVAEFEPGISIICGKGGSGKSTLLHMMAGLEPPSDGKIFYDNMSLYDDIDLSSLHRQDFSIIFQTDNLVQEFNVKDNILMPLRFDGKKDLTRFKELVELLELQDLLDMRPQSLSDMEQLRVCIARALVNNAAVVFADEPTGNLNEKDTKLGMELLTSLCRKYEASLILVTCDPDLLTYADHAFRMAEGELEKA